MIPNAENTSDLRSVIHGNVILPGEDSYDESRKIWNGMFDKKPGVIVQCKGKEDVVHAVKFSLT